MNRLIPGPVIVLAALLVMTCGRAAPPHVAVSLVARSTVDTAALTIDGAYGQAINGKANARCFAPHAHC